MRDRHQLSRRTFLGLTAAATAATLVPARAFASGLASSSLVLAPERSLSFFHTHTNERLTTAYCCDGDYVPSALGEVNLLLRDFRVNAVKPIDPQLLDLLFALNGRLGSDQPFHVISGYRTPETNAMLHIEGKAIDIRVPGIKLEHLRDTAAALHLGGVGYYPGSDFVHVDTGRVRHW
jgi:uncharacterized protein YcbK (DUF882 family)